jgi:hypothetical protein
MHGEYNVPFNVINEEYETSLRSHLCHFLLQVLSKLARSGNASDLNSKDARLKSQMRH